MSFFKKPFKNKGKKESNESLEDKVNNDSNHSLEVVKSEVEILKERLSELEKQVLKDRDYRNLLESNVKKKDFEQNLNDYLSDLPVDINSNTRKAAIETLDAIRAIETYGFSRYLPDIKREYKTRVITIDEFKNSPEDYLFKLHKGYLNFPLGINYSYVNKVLLDTFGNIGISTSNLYSNNGTVSFTTRYLLWDSKISIDKHKELEDYTFTVFNESELNVNPDKYDFWIKIDTLDFIKNYNSIIDFVKDLPEISSKHKKFVIKGFEATKTALLAGIELSLKAKIREPKDLLSIVDEEYKPSSNKLDNLEKDGLRYKFYNLLLEEPKGCSYTEINQHLPIRSKQQFYDLASKRTVELLAKKKKFRGLSEIVSENDLEKLSAGELVVFAVYFSRYIIEDYQNTDEGVKAVFERKLTNKMSGQCTDYSALSAHYLNEYLKKLYPEKFKNWRFGVESDVIGRSYGHAYLKIVHINPDYSTDVFFLDPTKLANHPINELKTPEEIIKKADALNLPILIDRNAEDLLYRDK